MGNTDDYIRLSNHVLVYSTLPVKGKTWTIRFDIGCLGLLWMVAQLRV
jgi:hypothetical protein